MNSDEDKIYINMIELNEKYSFVVDKVFLSETA